MAFALLLYAGCTPLNGDWSGDVECDDYALDVSISIEWTGNRYEGEGELDCTDVYGVACDETFDINVDADGAFGEQDLDVDLDDCEATVGGASSDVGCDNPDDVVWDGADTIEGDWADCTFEIERES